MIYKRDNILAIRNSETKSLNIQIREINDVKGDIKNVMTKIYSNKKLHEKMNRVE